jgi:hypothetical protein
MRSFVLYLFYWELPSHHQFSLRAHSALTPPCRQQSPPRPQVQVVLAQGQRPARRKGPGPAPRSTCPSVLPPGALTPPCQRRNPGTLPTRSSQSAMSAAVSSSGSGAGSTAAGSASRSAGGSWSWPSEYMPICLATCSCRLASSCFTMLPKPPRPSS